MKQHFDVLVIGAGIGGVVCAALLAHRGVEVLLLDKNSAVGGKAMTVASDGYKYELWPVAVTDALLNKLDEVVMELWPEMADCVSAKVRYGCAQVSGLTRDAVVPGQGGECIGLAQIVGQCGAQKPSARSPLQGLYFVGCDAGGYGCGTHQAGDSGRNVADMVLADRFSR
jgi:phytoene dehydrogenase-like protein